MTFTIVARCRRTGQFGIAVASSSPAVAARCAHVRAGVGVVATQNVTDPRLGPAALDLMQAGATPQAALDALATRSHTEHRQLIALNAEGLATRSGLQTLGFYGAAEGQDCAAAGNLLARPGIPAAMTAAFETALAATSNGELGARLLAALAAGLAAGGEAGPVHSAGLLVAGTESWALTDLRVDWDDTDPIGRLQATWEVWAPQMHDYVRRALDPDVAPGFAVPGTA